jgi:hypothetical protein
MVVTFRRRRSALSRGERVWRVEDDALVSVGSSGREKRYLWREIVSVRLYCDPTPVKPWRYVFELQPKHQRRVVIDNGHCVSRGVFEDRSASYTPFVRAALERLQAVKPSLRVLIGETPKRYFLLLLGALVLLAIVAYALIAMRTPFDALPYAGAVKLFVMAVLAAVFWRWVVGIVPRGVPRFAVRR